MSLYVEWAEAFNKAKISPQVVNYSFNPRSNIKDIDICYKNMSWYYHNIEIIKTTKFENFIEGKEWFIDSEEYQKLSKGLYDQYPEFKKEYKNYKNSQ